MNEAIIKIDNLTKSYGQKVALKNVSLELQTGKIVGLCGPNGSGKTTLIKVLNGLLKRYSGSVLIADKKPGAFSKSLISYLPDVTYLAEWMRGGEIITMFKDLYLDFLEEQMDNLLGQMQIDKNLRIKEMSKGTKEKFQLALVLSRQAQIYILDEPIGGVDPAARDLILETILNNYNENSLLLISTHLISDVEKIFDSVIFLKEGEVVLFDDVDAIRQKEERSIDELFREVFKC